MRYENLTDDELLRLVYMRDPVDPLLQNLSERLEMRIREVTDLKNDVCRLEDELDNFI